MSRIGNKIIEIPQGVKVEQKGQTLKVTGPLGNLQMDCYSGLEVSMTEDSKAIQVKNPSPDDRQCRQMHGTTRALIANMVTGVSKGFEKKMLIYGTGYNLKDQGGKLVLSIGFCHPIELQIPKGIKVNIEVAATRGNDVPAKFSVSGSDKHTVGQFAANIRKVRRPEPYKGKGIRYADEYVQRKVGKAFTSGGA